VQRRISVQGNETLAKLRAEGGRDPAHGGEVAKRRAAAVSAAKRREWVMLFAKSAANAQDRQPLHGGLLDNAASAAAHETAVA